MLLTCGQKNSFDLVISEKIARKYRLDIIKAEIQFDHIENYADEIIKFTDGLLPVSHWGGFLFSWLVNTRDTKVFVGFNGEYARSYYFNKGIFSLLFDRVSKFAVKRLLSFSPKFFKLEDYPYLSSSFRKSLESYNAINLASRIPCFSNQSLSELEKLDYFFFNQYGTYKTSLDISAFNAVCTCITPFFSNEWVRLIRKLPRYWKLGSWFHRYALSKLDKNLLKFGEEGFDSRTNASPPITYWLQVRKPKNVIHFVNQKIFVEDAFYKLLEQNSCTLTELIKPEFIKFILKRESKHFERVNLILLLYSLSKGAAILC